MQKSRNLKKKLTKEARRDIFSQAGEITVKITAKIASQIAPVATTVTHFAVKFPIIYSYDFKSPYGWS